MTRYLISDHHFDHDNIIGYCDRPFTSVGEMHDVLLSRFHETVDPDDTLYHLGDVAMAMRDGEKTGEWLGRLSDSAVLVRGNHDAALDPESVDYPVVSSCVLEAGEYRFYCTHRPEDTPEWWNGWVLHGHHHNNHPKSTPSSEPTKSASMSAWSYLTTGRWPFRPSYGCWRPVRNAADDSFATEQLPTNC
jgi:calcineurin-like phosphoesterase family protein